MSYIYLHNNSTTTGNGSAVDILAAYQERIPPVLQCFVTGSCSYVIEGSHDGAKWAAYYSGSADASKDLVVGIRFWRVRIASITGSFTASVGAVPDQNGQNVTPRVVAAFVVPVP